MASVCRGIAHPEVYALGHGVHSAVEHPQRRLAAVSPRLVVGKLHPEAVAQRVAAKKAVKGAADFAHVAKGLCIVHEGRPILGHVRLGEGSIPRRGQRHPQCSYLSP